MQHILLRSGKNPWRAFGAKRTLEKNVLGTNGGNLLFSTAVHRTLTTSTVTVQSNYWRTDTRTPAEVNEQFDAFVLPLANAFRPSWLDYMARITAFVKQLTIPVIVVGVGAQTAIDGNPARLSPIDAAVKEFVGAVLDRSTSLGVRGEVTYDYVRSLGFRDVEVIGCPSMYMWGPELPAQHRLDRLTPDAKVTITVSPYLKSMGPIVRHHLAAYPRLTYIPQDNDTLRRMLYGPFPGDAGKSSDVPMYLNHPLFAEDKTRFFIDPWPWMRYLASRDLSFGSRLHGSIAAVLAGTPALLLAHDPRTLELAKYHELPYRLLSDVPPNVDAAELYDAADFAPAIKGHAARFATYLSFLERNGLAHSYQPGESPKPFDDRIAGVRFPPPVRTRGGRHRYAPAVEGSLRGRLGRMKRRAQEAFERA